jgi:alpha-N-arabinofuranosidase
MVIETSSYFVQQMFSANRGNMIKEATSDSSFGPVCGLLPVQMRHTL